MKHTYVPTKEEIRKLRESIKVSQAVAASMVNATSATWSRYETGKDNMPPERWRLFTFEVGMHASDQPKAKDLEAQRLAQEEKEKMEQLAREWDPETYQRELIETEAKNWRYRDGRPVV